jgi:hypothetical protein
LLGVQIKWQTAGISFYDQVFTMLITAVLGGICGRQMAAWLGVNCLDRRLRRRTDMFDKRKQMGLKFQQMY